MLCHLLIKEWNMGILGVGIANCITHVIIFAVLNLAQYFTEEVCETVQRPDRRVLEGISTYMELGLPNALMLCMEWLVFETMLLLCGLLGVAIQAAQIILNNIYVFFFCLGLGMQSAACTCVGF